MYNEALHDRYFQCLQDAMARDEAASLAQQKGNYRAAAEGCEAAAALYAQAASNLLEAGCDCSPAEQSDFEKSVDRLIAISKDLKQHAARLRSARPPAAGEQKSGAVAANGEDEECAFVPAETPEVTFRDIAGLAEAKQLIMDEIINPVLYRELYRRFHIECNGGLLLFGPPGSGKTMVARAVAAQAKMAFFSVRCSDIVGKYFGEAEKHVQALFRAAREAGNAVIFLDEAEALACRRGGNSTVMNRLVPELLSQMDGFEKFEGRIIVIFATNRPYDIDPAFLRPGRLPNHCYIPLPDENVRREFLRSQIAKRPCAETIDVDALAKRTERFSCADLMNLVKRGCQRPVNRGIEKMKDGQDGAQELLTQQDLDLALEKLHPSVEPEEIARIEKWMVKVGMKLPAAA